MNPQTNPLPEQHLLVESDCQYFELGATIKSVAAAQLVYMPGLEHLVSAAVVQRIEAKRVDCPLPDWLALIEQEAGAAGLNHLRLYLTTEPPQWPAILRMHGYSRREEVLLVTPVEPKPRSELRLVPVQSPNAWTQRVALFQNDAHGSDGHHVDAAAWNAMEQRKAESRKFLVFNVLHGQDVIGAVGYLVVEGLFRMKNLYICPAYRRKGFGRQIVAALQAVADELELQSFGVMAVQHGPALALYRRCGLQPIGMQYEWFKRLSPS